MVYQTKLQASNYFWMDPFNPEDRSGLVLQNRRYIPIQRDNSNSHYGTKPRHSSMDAGIQCHGRQLSNCVNAILSGYEWPKSTSL